MSRKTARSLHAAGLIGVYLLGLGPLAASELSLTGRLITPDGKTTIKQFPVIAQGASGTYITTTDEDGIFSFGSLPPGQYEVMPANEPSLKEEVEIASRPRWWQIVAGRDDVETLDLGDFEIAAGKMYFDSPGVAEDADPVAPDRGVVGVESITPDTGMAANDGLPRRSVADSAEPYTGDVLAGITADDLIGMNVVDATGDSVGSVSDLLLGAEDQVDHAIIDVGGFLGFGAKSVAITLDELTIAEGDGEVVLNTTRDELDAMSEWTRGDDGWMSN